MQCVIHSTYFVKPGTRYEFKTHLTNHYLEIRCGKNLQKVVKATGIRYKSTSHIYIIPIFKTVINHGLKKVDRKEKGIFVNDR